MIIYETKDIAESVQDFLFSDVFIKRFVVSVSSKINSNLESLRITGVPDVLKEDTKKLESQAGFSRGYSCETALMNVEDYIVTGLDRNKFILRVLLDFDAFFAKSV